MKKIITLLISLGTCQAIAGNLQLNADQIAAFGIETTGAQSVGKTFSKTFPAKITVPNARLRVVSSPLDGVIETLLVAEGEDVTQGQSMATIRSARLLELQTAYLESRTRRLLSAETVNRDRKLRAEGIIAQRRLLAAESEHREKLNAEARDRQALTLAGMPDHEIKELARKQRLNSNLTIRAPFDGVVLEQIATTGQRLTEADPLYKVGDLDTLWVEVHVPLDSLGSTAPGTHVHLQDQDIDATVITVGRMVHGTDQGVLVRAEIRNGTKQLRPGQFIKARLKHVAGSSDVRLPSAAVIREDSREYVFVRNAQGFEPVAVNVVARAGDEVVIRGDITEAASVVIRGTAALKAIWAGDETQ